MIAVRQTLTCAGVNISSEGRRLKQDNNRSYICQQLLRRGFYAAYDTTLQLAVYFVLRITHSLPFHNLTCPNPDNSILPSLRKISILDSHSLHRSWSLAIFHGRQPCSAIPMSTFQFIIHFCNVFATCRDYSSVVKHHRTNWIVIGVGIENGACSQVPDLNLG
jgi:hypothetical protein